MMRLLFLTIALSLVSVLAIAEIFVDEDFEDAAFSPPVQYLCDPNDPATPPNTGPCDNTADHSTNEKKAGSYSLECVYAMAQAAGFRMYPADYGDTDFGNKSYLRFYMKWDSGFRFYNRTKIFRWHVPGNDIYVNTNACGSSGVTWNEGGGYWEGETSNSVYGELTFHRTGESTNQTVTNEIGNSDWVVEVGTGWYMFEFYYDASTTNFTLWMMRPSDSAATQVISSSYGGANSTSANGLLDVNWINSVSDGSGGKLWIDELVIADQYIGPLSSDESSAGSHLTGITPSGCTF